MNNIFFDTETTGLRKKTSSSKLFSYDEVAQIGGLICDADFTPIRAFCYNCDILLPDIPAEASHTNHLSMSVVRETSSDIFLEQVLADYLPEFFEEDVTFFGYNTNFDISMVNQTILDSPIKVDWGTFNQSSILQASGHSYIDICERVRQPKYRYKLSSLMNTESPQFKDFISKYQSSVKLYGNLDGGKIGMHNSYVDSICSYLVWMDRLWQKKVF